MFTIAIRAEEKGLFAALHTHSFRDENINKEKEISPTRFRLANGFLDDKTRISLAEKEASTLLSSGEKLSKRPPFIFRAH